LPPCDVDGAGDEDRQRPWSTLQPHGDAMMLLVASTLRSISMASLTSGLMIAQACGSGGATPETFDELLCKI
jgi:hypothetical protein